MASKGSLRKSLRSVGRKRKGEIGRTEKDRHERWIERERERGMTARRKKYSRIRGTIPTEKREERERERDRKGGGENMHTKMSSSNPDLRRRGNRQRANFESSPCGRKPRNFCLQLSSARFAGWLAIKKM